MAFHAFSIKVPAVKRRVESAESDEEELPPPIARSQTAAQLQVNMLKRQGAPISTAVPLPPLPPAPLATAASRLDGHFLPLPAQPSPLLLRTNPSLAGGWRQSGGSRPVERRDTQLGRRAGGGAGRAAQGARGKGASTGAQVPQSGGGPGTQRCLQAAEGSLRPCALQVLLEVGDDWRAVQSARRAVELSPAWPEGHLTLSRAQVGRPPHHAGRSPLPPGCTPALPCLPHCPRLPACPFARSPS